MQEPRSGAGVCDRAVSSDPEQVEVVAVAEVAEQQHSDVVVAHRCATRCRCRPGSRSRSCRCPAPTLPSATSCPSACERALDVLGDDRPRIGHVAVVALPDDRDHDVVRAPSRGHRSRPGGRCRRRACRRGRPASRSMPRSSISSLPVSSPTPLTVAVPAGAGSDGGATTVTPVALAAGRLRVADQDARDVGDRVARPRLEPADRPAEIAPALSHPRAAACLASEPGSWSRQAASWSRAPAGDSVGIDPVAGLEAPRAARVEAAPGGHRGRVGQLARSSSSRCPPPPAGGNRDRGDQRLRVGVLGALDHVDGRALLDDPPQVHDRDPVAERPGEAEVVGDEDQRQVRGAAGAPAGRRGSAPAPRRRASRPARRRSAPRARARARRRSRPAGAGRRRAGADSGRGSAPGRGRRPRAPAAPARRARPSATPWTTNGSATIVAHPLARVERLVGVLEDHLDPPAQRAEARLAA